MDQTFSLPFEVALAALFAVVMARVNATYWIGRGTAAGMERTRFADALHRPKAAKAQALVILRRRRTAVAPEDTVV